MANVRKFLFFDPATGQYREQTATDTIQIANGVDALDAVNKSQLDAVAAAADAAVEAEEARALAAEAALQSAIDGVAADLSDEVDRATAAEQAIAADLATEVSDREAAITALDAELSADILAEQTRAQAAEASLQSALTQEIADRVAGDLTEKNRAEAAEASLLSAINTEVSDRIAAVSAEASARAAADATELARAQAAEADLQSQITAEVAAREAAITSLNSTLSAAITAEETARIAADGVLQSNIDDEESARIAADATLTSDLAAEVARATAAESVLTADLASEVAAREAAVSAEALARQNADDGLAADIAAEEVRALAAEGVLQSNIDAEEAARIAAVSAEEAARIAGDAATLASANAYADSLVEGISFKSSVRVALPTSFDMGGSTINMPADYASVASALGTEAGDRILLIQPEGSAGAMNAGIYVVNSGNTALVRAPDMAVGSDASGAYVYVEEGVVGSTIPHANPGTSFVCANVKGGDIVGTDPLDFAVFQRVENLTFSNGVQKIGLDVSAKVKTNGAIGAGSNGLELLFDTTLLKIDGSGNVTINDPLAGGPLNIADSLHGHSHTSAVRPSTAANEAHFAKFNGDSATWDSSSCMAFVESKDGSGTAVIVFSGKGEHSSLSTALSAFSVGDTVYVGGVAGEFSDFASVPSGKWAIPVGKKMASNALLVDIGTALLKA
jgi:hypothetical protein